MFDPGMETGEAILRAMDGAQDIIYILDREQRHIAVYGKMLRDRGLEKSHFLGRSALDIFGPEAGAVHTEANRRALSGENVTYYWEGHIGSTITYFETSVSPLVDGAGNIQGIFGVGRDITAVRADQISLSRHRAFSDVLLQNSRTIIVVLDEDKSIRLFNRYAEEITGYEAGEVLGKNWFDLFLLPEDMSVLDPLFKSIWERGEGAGFHTNSIRCKNGERKIFHWSNTVIEERGRKYILSMGMDITKQDQMERDLNHRENLFRRLVDGIPDIVYSFSMDRGWLYGSGKIAAYLAVDESELQANPLLPLEMIHPDDRRQVVHSHLISKNGPQYDEEFRVRDRLGNWHWVHNRSFLFEREGDDTIVHGIASDITRMKQESQALAESEKKFRELITLAQEGIVVYDSDGRVSLANPAAARMLGMEVRELIGKEILSFIDKEDHWSAGFHLLDRIRTVSEQFELELVRKDGSRRYATVVSSPIYQEGEFRGAILGVVDITARRAAELDLREKTRELEDLNRTLEERVRLEIDRRRNQEHLLLQQARLASMTEMIHSIIHHWRQPLNALGLLIQDLMDSYEFGDLNREYLESVTNRSMDEIRSMSGMLDNFRNFFRQSKEKLRFDALWAVRETIVLNHGLFEESGIRIELSDLVNSTLCDSNHLEDCKKSSVIAVYLEGYPNEFKHTILGILHNSRDAILEQKKGKGDSLEGVIRLVMNREENQFSLVIEDNGGGVAAQTMEKIFEPYFSTKEPGQGVGLGLYMAKMIVETGMGGSIMAENGEVGLRTTLRIPVVSEGP